MKASKFKGYILVIALTTSYVLSTGFSASGKSADSCEVVEPPTVLTQLGKDTSERDSCSPNLTYFTVRAQPVFSNPFVRLRVVKGRAGELAGFANYSLGSFDGAKVFENNERAKKAKNAKNAKEPLPLHAFN